MINDSFSGKLITVFLRCGVGIGFQNVFGSQLQGGRRTRFSLAETPNFPLTVAPITSPARDTRSLFEKTRTVLPSSILSLLYMDSADKIPYH